MEIYSAEIKAVEDKRQVAYKRYIMTQEQYRRTFEFLERLLTEDE